jgi:hypothetical protein
VLTNSKAAQRFSFSDEDNGAFGFHDPAFALETYCKNCCPADRLSGTKTNLQRFIAADMKDAAVHRLRVASINEP